MVIAAFVAEILLFSICSMQALKVYTWSLAKDNHSFKQGFGKMFLSMTRHFSWERKYARSPSNMLKIFSIDCPKDKNFVFPCCNNLL